MQTIHKKHAAVILAAGHSRRMGTPKLNLKLPDGITFIASAVNGFLQFGCSEIIVVVNPDGMASEKKQQHQWPERCKFVINPYPDRGRFYSLQRGLIAIECPASAFVHNVDNPLLSREVLEALSNRAGEADYICPSYKGQHGHPVLLSEKIIAEAIQALPPLPNMRDFFNLYNKTIVPVSDANILLNINDPGTYQKIHKS